MKVEDFAQFLLSVSPMEWLGQNQVKFETPGSYTVWMNGDVRVSWLDFLSVETQLIDTAIQTDKSFRFHSDLKCGKALTAKLKLKNIESGVDKVKIKFCIDHRGATASYEVRDDRYIRQFDAARFSFNGRVCKIDKTLYERSEDAVDTLIFNINQSIAADVSEAKDLLIASKLLRYKAALKRLEIHLNKNVDIYLPTWLLQNLIDKCVPLPSVIVQEFGKPDFGTSPLKNRKAYAKYFPQGIGPGMELLHLVWR